MNQDTLEGGQSSERTLCASALRATTLRERTVRALRRGAAGRPRPSCRGRQPPAGLRLHRLRPAVQRRRCGQISSGSPARPVSCRLRAQRRGVGAASAPHRSGLLPGEHSRPAVSSPFTRAPPAPRSRWWRWSSGKNWLEANPVLKTLEPDVEALLVNRMGGACECYRVGIDECYKLVGLIRMHWKGFSGGQAAWDEIGRFFVGLKERSHA